MKDVDSLVGAVGGATPPSKPTASAGCIATAILPNPNPTTSYLAPPSSESQSPRKGTSGWQYIAARLHVDLSERLVALDSSLPFSPPAYLLHIILIHHLNREAGRRMHSGSSSLRSFYSRQCRLAWL